jgi:outer membrane receptor for ferrienterochelin and colicins
MEISKTKIISLRKKRGFATALFAVLFLSGMAQQIEVRDRTTKESIPGAIITLTNTGSGKMRHNVSDISGSCAFPVCDTAQLLEVKLMGYKTFKDTLAAGCPSAKCLFTFSSDSLGVVVITAQYGQTAIENAVQPIRIIDRAKIDAMGAQNLQQLLTNETNIRLSQDPVLGSSMSLQGLSGENVKILIDGIPLVGRQNGNIDLSQISLANVERVEIVEGPQSVNYGTNALAGVINLITSKRQDHTFSLGTDLFYESSGQYNALIRTGIQHRHGIILLNGGRNYFDGWSNDHNVFRYEKPHIADSTRVLQWKPREQYFGTAQFIRNIDRGQFGISSDFFHEKITNRGMPRAPYQETAFDDYYRTLRSTSMFYSRIRLNEHQKIEMQAAYSFYQRTKNTYFKDLTTLDQQLVEDVSMQDTSTFSLYKLRATFFRSGDSLRLSYEAGIDFEYETTTGARILDKSRAIGDYAGFASAEYRPWSWMTLRPGFRWSYNTGYVSQPSPSLNVLVKLPKELKLRMGYARGFRAPALKELYFYFVDINHNIRGNEMLIAEHSNNYSANLAWNRSSEKIKYNFSAGGFYNDVFNLITLALVEGTEYSYINIGRSKTTGVTTNAGIRSATLQANASFAYIARSNEFAGQENVPQFSWSPETSGSLVWKESKTAITTGLFVKYTGRLPQFILTTDNEIQRAYTGAYTTLDISFSRKFMKDKFVLEAGCRNVLDVRTVPSTSTTGGTHSDGSGSMAIANGRNYFFRVQYHIDFDKKGKE